MQDEAKVFEKHREGDLSSSLTGLVYVGSSIRPYVRMFLAAISEFPLLYAQWRGLSIVRLMIS